MNQVLQNTSILNTSWNKLFTCLNLKKVSPFLLVSEIRDVLDTSFWEHW